MVDSYNPNIKDYESKYSNLPDTQSELIEYLENKLNINKQDLEEEEKRIKSIIWNHVEFTFYMVPQGSPRPKLSKFHFYVKGAKQLKKIFQKCLVDYNIICTRCDYVLKAYMPTPVSQMTKMEILLAEKGLIRPIITPDWDNLGKTYPDALQEILLLNDNLINPGRVEKYYSIKPRINISIDYQTDFDCKYNMKKTINSTSYKKIIT